MLPDGMYVSVPSSLKAPKEQGAARCRLEFGGRLRSGQEAHGAEAAAGPLQRLVVEYDVASGAFVGMAHELYGAE